MLPLQERWDKVICEQERMLFLLASFYPEGTTIPLWLLGLAVGMGEPEGTSELLKRACHQLQALELFEEMTGERVQLSSTSRQFGQQLVQAAGIQSKVLVAEAAQRLFSACWTLDTLSQRTLRIGYHECREQVQSIRHYLGWLGFQEYSELLEQLDHWMSLESSLLTTPIIGTDMSQKKPSACSSLRSLRLQQERKRVYGDRDTLARGLPASQSQRTPKDVTWWPEILPDLFYQQLYNRSVEAGSLLTIQEEPTRWLRLTCKVGVEDLLGLRLYLLGPEWEHEWQPPVGESLLVHVAFSPNGQLMLTSSYSSGVQFWDVESGRELPRLQGDTIRVTSAAFSPDGQLMLTGTDSGIVRLWAMESRCKVRQWDTSGRVTSVAFSPDGRLALIGTQYQGAQLWEVENGSERRRWLALGCVISVAFSPDGRLALIGTQYQGAQLWEVESGREVGKLQSHTIGGIISVAFSPDGRLALTGSYLAVHLWEVESGRQLVGLKYTGKSVAFSPDGRLALTGSSKAAHLWEVERGEEIRRFGPMTSVSSVAFSPDGKQVLTGSDDNVARLWEVSRGGECSWDEEYPSLITSVAFSPDGQIALTGSENGSVHLWEVSSGRKLRKLQGSGSSKITSVAFSPDGQRVLAGSYKVAYLWEVEHGQPVLLDRKKSWITNVAFSPDGQLILTGDTSDGIRLWNVESGQMIWQRLWEEQVRSIAFSPDGRQILIGSNFGARLRKVSNGRLQRTLRHRWPVGSVAFSPDGRLALTSAEDFMYNEEGGTVQLWEVRSGRKLRQLLYVQEATSMAFSPDGRLAIVGDRYGRVYFYRGQGSDVGNLLGIYVATYEVGAIYWQQSNQVVLADKGGPTWGPHFSHVMLEGKWE
ncbi:WD40 repeat domain-containing protein [Dictyobacter kobayashii]|uniref:Uncharacterized protein n=1 Tax=Dictyobacter kobayashii TaxID=2014872 RepID=A0A402ASG0_9CHLR|nr:WD40 repeat domain-containing protein [Dictyobacter kobayashii]GCE22036.1 hypothetical protein KDK_58360 [Dictyobacter kobayashii]